MFKTKLLKKVLSKTNKKAQISLFVIIAVLIVASASLVLYLKSKPSAIPAQLMPLENQFLDCVNNMALEGIGILGEQGGYIELPAVEEGSAYMPFQSQLNFFGVNIPYWFYVSGSNLYKKQAPSIGMMEKELSDYITKNINSCDFSTFTDSGYKITKGKNAETKTTIYNDNIAVKVSYPLTLEFGDVKRRISEHSARIDSDFGSLYSTAKKIFDSEQENLFLEEYTYDIIVLNAPTTGAIVSCAPKIWMKDKVESDIRTALQNNIGAIKIKGSYYKLANPDNKYFVTDIGIDVSNQVRFFYSPLFETKFDIAPSEEGIMRAEPIGNQQGLGILGFCYVPYHFVYSLAYPVLIQVYGKDSKFFQFPVVVVIDKNTPRQGVATTTPEQKIAELCQKQLGNITAYTYDSKGKPLNARIQYKCLSTICDIGQTAMNEDNESALTASFPQCVNGFVLASADGYATTKQQLSTNEEAIVQLNLNSFYTLKVKLVKSTAFSADESVLINFISDDYSTSLVYPSQTEVKLAEGSYKVEAYLFSSGNVQLSSENVRKCIKVPASGLLGILGAQREECYDMQIPQQTLTNIIAGGGKLEWNIDEASLEKSSDIEISIPEFAKPQTIEGVQDNYALIDASEISIRLV